MMNILYVLLAVLAGGLAVLPFAYDKGWSDGYTAEIQDRAMQEDKAKENVADSNVPADLHSGLLSDNHSN